MLKRLSTKQKIGLAVGGGLILFLLSKALYMSIPEPTPLPKNATLAQKMLWAAGFFKVVNAALPQLSVASQLMVTAHACYESGWGTLNHLARTKNPFNVTAGDAWIKAGKPIFAQKNADKEYDAAGNVKTIDQNWRVYGSMTDAVKDYWAFLGGQRYEAQAVRSYLMAADVDGFVRALSAARYFTLPVDQYLADFRSVLGRVKSAVGVSA